MNQSPLLVVRARARAARPKPEDLCWGLIGTGRRGHTPSPLRRHDSDLPLVSIYIYNEVVPRAAARPAPAPLWRISLRYPGF